MSGERGTSARSRRRTLAGVPKFAGSGGLNSVPGNMAGCAAVPLPGAKTFGAEAAIQVLGGADRVRDRPVERMLRDCRAFSIHEGATAIWGPDLPGRRVPGGGAAAVLRDLLDRVVPGPGLAEAASRVAATLAEVQPRAREVPAAPLLRLLGLACADGLLRRAGRQTGPLAGRYAELAEHHAAEAGTRADAPVAGRLQGRLGAAFDAAFDAAFPA